jgi:hypothetical protein
MTGQDPRANTQTAPYPDALASLVGQLRYRRHMGWRVWLEDDLQRDEPGRHTGESRGLTLIVQRCGADTYHPENVMAVNHYFAVPPATYNRRSWMRWLFDQLGKVDTHERMEDFVLAVPHSAACPNGQHGLITGWNPAEPAPRCQECGTELVVGTRDHRPFAPNHSPGNDPYSVRELGTVADAETSFRGERKTGSQLLADDPARGSFQEIDGV